MTPSFELSAEQRAIYMRYATLALPRHTSYPAASHWTDAVGGEAFARHLSAESRPGKAVELYIHVPFCRSLCLYCGCTKDIVTDERRRRDDPSAGYLEGVDFELARIHSLKGRLTAEAIHLGGGTPTFLKPEQLARLWQIVSRHVAVHPAASMAAEVDPRTVLDGQLETLTGLGFKRLSLGIQDFDPEVQKAIARHQSEELVAEVVAKARRSGVMTLNFDLIYGLPFQTLASMERTIDSVIRLAPTRIAFYRLAVMPHLFKWQKAFTRMDLPSPELTLDLLLLAIQKFAAAGYRHIGLDHFARPGDALYDAEEKRRLHRTFNGMVDSLVERPVIGVGPSAISTLEGGFFQNVKTLEGWRDRLSRGFATERGLELSSDDRIRGSVIQDLYGAGVVDLRAFESRFGRSLWHAVPGVEPALEQLAKDGLVEWTSDALTLTSGLGRLLTRVVAAVFDGHIPRDAWRHGVSERQASRVG